MSEVSPRIYKTLLLLLLVYLLTKFVAWMFSANEFRGRKWPAMLLASRCVHPWLAFAISESQSVPFDCFENWFGLPGFSCQRAEMSRARVATLATGPTLPISQRKGNKLSGDETLQQIKPTTSRLKKSDVHCLLLVGTVKSKMQSSRLPIANKPNWLRM